MFTDLRTRLAKNGGIKKEKTRPGCFSEPVGTAGRGHAGRETTTKALERELEEELGLRVSHIEPAFFKDGFYRKLTPGGDLIPLYIIFLVFDCQTQVGRIHLNEEFSEHKWVKPEEISSLDLNEVTHDTLTKAERLYRQKRGYPSSAGSEKHDLSRE